jgi:hypothetical protein
MAAESLASIRRDARRLAAIYPPPRAGTSADRPRGRGLFRLFRSTLRGLPERAARQWTVPTMRELPTC